MKGTLKRWIAIVFVVALLGSLLAACGGGDAATPSASTGGEATPKASDEADKDDGKDDEASAGGDATATNLPREETLYYAGLGLWAAPQTFNPIAGVTTFPMPNASGFALLYETLFSYNLLTGEMEPLIADSYEWTDDLTCEVKINPDAHWNDGEKLTAEDVAYTFNLANEIAISWSSIWTNCESIEATDDTTVVFKMKADNPNRLLVNELLASTYIIPKHIWEPKYEELGETDLRQWQNFEDPVGSGPYKIYYFDDTRVVTIRDDNYWGQTESRFGKLPTPKYIAHLVYKDNAAANNAFKAGEADISQAFIPEIWKVWEGDMEGGTYLKELPYHIPGGMPSIFFNMELPGLDNPEVRRAIGYSINYPKVAELALSGYSADMVPSILMPTEWDQYLNNSDELDALRWTYDVDKANEILDGLGAEKGSDGIRVLNGERMGPWSVECPKSFSDWTAALEIVATGSKDIGVEIVVDLPERPTWENHYQTGEFDMIMYTPAGTLSPSQPWQRVRYLMYSKELKPRGEQIFLNFSRFQNDRADELIEAIPNETDEAKIKEMYTELDKIWLENVPSLPLMYRPGQFYEFNETVWTGFPTEDNNPNNIPPFHYQAGNKLWFYLEPKN